MQVKVTRKRRTMIMTMAAMTMKRLFSMPLALLSCATASLAGSARLRCIAPRLARARMTRCDESTQTEEAHIGQPDAPTR